jgi:hypothetical protein
MPLVQTSAKRQLEDNPEWSARRAYNTEINKLPLPEASLAVPLSTIQRSLNHFKVRNRPPLPATRQDLILLPAHQATTDGRRLLLIDDGLAMDRLLVFGTALNIER